jgi:aryl carrier-like protein
MTFPESPRVAAPHANPAPPPDTPTPTRAGMRRDVAEILGASVTAIAEDDNLLDWGLDSVRLMALAQRWQDRGWPVALSDLVSRPTLADWWTLLAPPV